MYLLILWIAKIIQRITKIFGNGGAALPGLFVETISHKFLSIFLAKLSEGIIVVSGTNGKTTTTKIISETLIALGDRVMTNASGSNMTRGLISTIVSKSTILGRLPYDIAILEVDEAYAAIISKSIPIRGAVVLNVMRDQLDRFGEIDKTAKLLENLTLNAREFMVVNSCDSRVNNLSCNKKSKRITFGISKKLTSSFKNEDNWHEQSTLKVKDSNYTLLTSKDKDITVGLLGKEYNISPKLKGAHNHLNLVAALAVVDKVKPSIDIATKLNLITNINPAFGRGEEIAFGDCKITLFLIKNPSSFIQTAATVEMNNYDTVSIVINDAYADSRDVSWLWDVDMSYFKKARKIIAGGTRGYDVAVRLKHEDVILDEIILSERELYHYLKSKNQNHVVFCSYTAMLNFRKMLVKFEGLEKVE